MKQPIWRMWTFVAAASVLLAVPAVLVLRQEWTLKRGAVYRFRTEPVDPYDAFRGRYVALNPVPNMVEVPGSERFHPGDDVYLTLETGADGYAGFSGAASKPPAGRDHIKARVLRAEQGVLSLRLPFDRFYLEESLAPAAEAAYMERSRNGVRDAHIVVRVRRGGAVIESLWVDGMPIEDLVRSHRSGMGQ